MNKLNYRQRRQLSYWIMLLPFLIGFVTIMLGVYFNSLRFSFETINMLPDGGFSQTWAGFSNFHHILTEDPDYMTNLNTSLVEMAMFTVFIVIFSLFIAVLLNRKMPGRAFFRAMFFIPVILATGFVARADMYSLIMDSVAAGLEAQSAALGTETGGMFNFWEVQQLLFALNFSPMLTSYALIAANRIIEIINGSGVQILIFLAGLQSISASIYESAEIDGATGWESFWLITFPMISPLILVNIVYTIINFLTDPANSIMLQIEAARGRAGGMGIASAMAWFYFAIVMLCVAVVAAVVSRYVYYQQKD